MNSKVSVAYIFCVMCLLLSGCGSGPSKSFVKDVLKENYPISSEDVEGATRDVDINLTLTDSDIFNSYTKEINDETVYFYKIRATYEWDGKDDPDKVAFLTQKLNEEQSYQDGREKGKITDKYNLDFEMVNNKIRYYQTQMDRWTLIITNYPNVIKEINERDVHVDWKTTYLDQAKADYDRAVKDRDSLIATGELQKELDKKADILKKQNEEMDILAAQIENRKKSTVIVPSYLKKTLELTISFIQEGNEWKYDLGTTHCIETITKLSDGTVDKRDN